MKVRSYGTVTRSGDSLFLLKMKIVGISSKTNIMNGLMISASAISPQTYMGFVSLHFIFVWLKQDHIVAQCGERCFPGFLKTEKFPEFRIKI